MDNVVAGVTARQRPCWLRPAPSRPLSRSEHPQQDRRSCELAAALLADGSRHRLQAPAGSFTVLPVWVAQSLCRSAEVRGWERDAAAREPGLTAVLASLPARLAGQWKPPAPPTPQLEPTGPGPLGAIRFMIAGEDRVLRDGDAAPVPAETPHRGERRPGATPWTSAWSRLLPLGSALPTGTWCGPAVEGLALRRQAEGGLLVARRVSARGATPSG